MMKKWYHSKTLYTNIIGIAVIIVSGALAKPELAAEIVVAEGGILAIVNLILRCITNQGLTK